MAYNLYEDDRERRRKWWLRGGAGVAVAALFGLAFWFWPDGVKTMADAPVIVDDPVVADLDDALEGADTVAEALPDLSEPEEPAVPEVLVDYAPSFCPLPGDGFRPTPAGAPPGADVDFTQPFPVEEPAGGYVLPVNPAYDSAGPVVGSACVTVIYDITDGGEVVDAQALFIEPVSAESDPYYAQAAVALVESVRFEPGRRNGKPVRINQNMVEVRFEG